MEHFPHFRLLFGAHLMNGDIRGIKVRRQIQVSFPLLTSIVTFLLSAFYSSLKMGHINHLIEPKCPKGCLNVLTVTFPFVLPRRGNLKYFLPWFSFHLQCGWSGSLTKTGRHSIFSTPSASMNILASKPSRSAQNHLLHHDLPTLGDWVFRIAENNIATVQVSCRIY